MYIYKTYVRMHDTDSAGVIFFASQLEVAHLAFEEFLESKGLGLGRMIEETDYRLPIAHAESDYKAPIKLGEHLRIELIAERIGTTSFTLGYTIRNKGGTVVGTAKTVHVAVTKDNWSKRPIPDEIRAALDTLRES